MNAELERLVNALIEGNHCYNCGTPFSIEPSELDANDDGVYISDYSCYGCEADYAIVVEDEKAFLRLEYSRTDEDAPEELISPFQRRRKEALQRQSHPAKNLIEGYHELNAALTLLWQNRKRILDECNTLREEVNTERDQKFHRRVHADIHNYVASAYIVLLAGAKTYRGRGGHTRRTNMELLVERISSGAFELQRFRSNR